MKMLFLQSSFKVNGNRNRDVFISIPHIVSVGLIKAESHDEEIYYEIKILLESKHFEWEYHTTEELAKARLKDILLKINHPSQAQFNYDLIDNLKI